MAMVCVCVDTYIHIIYSVESFLQRVTGVIASCLQRQHLRVGIIVISFIFLSQIADR